MKSRPLLLGALVLCAARLAAQTTPTTSPAVRATRPSSARFITPGVSRALAQHRTATLRDVRYTLALSLLARDTAYGEVKIAVRSVQRDDIVVDYRGHAIDRVIVNGRTIEITPAVWNGAHLVINRAFVVAGVNQITITFRSPIAAAGASIIRTRDATDGRDYLYTLLVPSDANLLFPCFDQPDLKARVRFSATTTPSWRVLANGALQQVDTTTAGVVHHFAATAPMSTYLIAFAAGPWEVITRNVAIREGATPAPVSMWVRASRAKEAEADSLIASNARALRWLGDWFGVPYAFGKYDFLLAPAFPFGGMEHPGAVFYNEESFIYRERPTASQLLGRQATTFHEVAHQWFGDYFTMTWFDDLWLKEGFATYMAAKMQASLEPNANAWKTFYLRNKPVAYNTDATAGTTPVWQQLANLDQAKSNYGPIVYNKAPSILRQLDYLVGERQFQAGIQRFLRAHPYGNATWRELLQSVGAVSGRDLRAWGAQWILRPGMPIIEQSLRLRGDRIAELTLTQRPAQPALSGAGAWPLKVQLLLAYDDGTMERIPFEFQRARAEVVAARGKRAPAFVFANDGDYGYALVLPDAHSVAWLEQHVGTVRDDLLRAVLWGALWDMVRETRLSPERYVAMVLRALPSERDEQITSALVGRMSTALSRYVSAAARDSLQPRAEALLLAGAQDTARAYGPRKTFFDASIGLARDAAALRRLDTWLDADSALGIALRPPTRWSIVTKLVARSAPSAEGRLAAEMRRDSTTEGRRQAFVAQAARADSAVKAALYARWFADASLNEEWVTSSLRAFFEADQSELSRMYLEPSLDTLPWIQQNRRIFFLGSWLGAVVGGQQSADALAAIDRWLAGKPGLAPDLRQKVLQARDELERTVRIRAVGSTRAQP